MDNFLHLATERAGAYLHYLDLKSMYSELLNDVYSPSRNYHLSQLESQISFTKLRWESIHIPPSVMTQLASIQGVKEPQQNQAELHSEEPTEEEAMVPEATKIDELFVDDASIVDSFDSLDELIPQFFFVEEEDDNSLNFELLIPSFLFDEEEHSFDKELVFRHNNLYGKSRFSLLFDASRGIFDRGKRIPDSFNSNEKLIVPRISSLGYQLDFSDILLIVRLCITDATFQVESKLFDKMSEFVHLNDVSVEFFWQLKMDEVFDRGKEYHLIPGLSSFINSSRDNFDTNTSCVIVGTGFTFMAAYYDNFNSKLMAELGYYFILLYECSNVSLFVKEGDSHDINQLFEQRPQQRHTPWIFVLLQMPRQRESGTYSFVLQLYWYGFQLVIIVLLVGQLPTCHREIHGLLMCSVGRGKKFFSYSCHVTYSRCLQLIFCAPCVLSSVRELAYQSCIQLVLVHGLFKYLTLKEEQKFSYSSSVSFLRYSSRLLCAISTTILFVQGAETGIVCKLRKTRLQLGTVLLSRLILQVTGTNAAGTMMELFDQLHHSRWSFCNLLIL
ncbi:uncharacterized protein LOC113298324 isoform X2 [Papaver somniferum]|uniref:uncharacterized protein LOC113298324 isoform X2 n=1 Tax=Papaver somniferum TaxID=3469 RepID=UPI000E6F67ED|nr:uncharacterized protein LOC113298324 isoform X2 [Papaver somniferum]